MIRKDKTDPMDLEIKDYFEELHKDMDLPAGELPDIQMASWEEIEELAGRMEVSEAKGESVEGVTYVPVKISKGRRKRLAVAFLAATLGALLLAGVANGDRLYRYMIEQRWESGQNVITIDSNKVHDGTSPYAEVAAEVFEKTGVQSVQPMDHRWELSDYRIEGGLSYLTYSNNGSDVVIKQRNYSGTDISLQMASDKLFLGNEVNELIPDLNYDIYYEEIVDGRNSYESTFTLGGSVYIVRSTCEEDVFRDFLKSVYIKNTLK